jgi:CheY-like chemotaxis protein
MPGNSTTPSSPRPLPIRVLVVDDSLAVLDCLKEFFIKLPLLLEVATAENGLAAVEQVGRTGADLVVMDVNMPRMNGLKAADEIHRLSPETKIILISIHDDATTREDCRNHHAVAFVPKIGMQRQLKQEIASLFPQTVTGPAHCGGPFG